MDRNKIPLQILGKVAGCVVRTLETFQGTRAHRAVIFAIAQLSCYRCHRRQQNIASVVYSLISIDNTELHVYYTCTHSLYRNARDMASGPQPSY